MREQDWNKIKENLSVLHENLEPDELVSRLYQHGVLSEPDQDKIMCERPRLDKVKKLLQILRTKELRDVDVYSVFHSQLKETQEFLACKLKPPGKAPKPPFATSESTKGRNVDHLQNLDVEGVCQFLEPILKKNKITDPDTVLQSFTREKIKGRVLLHTTVSELKEICPHLTFGDRKTIILERDEFIQHNQSFIGASEDRPKDTRGGLEHREYARKFDTSTGYTEKYKKGKILDSLQTSVRHMTDPIHTCIPFGDGIDVNSVLETIGWETVKFAASCMNERANGTIHFGVYDGNDGTHEHGEIYGLTDLDKRDCEEAISSSILKSFPSETRDTAIACIRPSKYVDVISKNDYAGFVLEVDVNPKASLVKEEVYYVKDQFLEHGQREPRQYLFRFKGGVPQPADAGEIVHFMKSIPSLTRQRLEAEKALATTMANHDHERLLHRLQGFLCDGDTNMGDVYPILVINAIDSNISMEELHSKFSFIGDINWICIFDFDPIGCNTGIYNYLANNQDKEFKVKLTDDFDQRGSSHPQMQVNNDKLLEDMSTSNLKPWIFCNGYEKLDKQELGVMEWKRQRSEGFKEAVRYFSYEIPRDRAKVVYLLLSKNYNVMLEAAEELSVKFQDQWIVISETDSVAAQWQEQLVCRNVVEKISLASRFIMGNNWEDISTCVKEITGMTNAALNNGECSLVDHFGRSIQLPKNIQNKLCDLEILSSTECDHFEILNEEEKDKIAKEQETRFYQGHPPSWVNFYHGAHVLRRKNHEELLKNVDRALKGDVPDNVNIGRVAIYHQPGSGGTTTAKQVLWDRKEKVRCCTLKCHSKESHNQIVDLWRFEEKDVTKALPVLVMVDNLDDEKLEDLTESLQAEANKHLQGVSRVMCVLLLCQRHSSLPREREQFYFDLKQKLHPEETNWFRSKYNYLADSFRRHKGPNPKHLLSLNIMKENFSEKYIENTVSEILRDIDTSKERVLIKYVSLLNAYDQQFRGIPLPCFDPMMTKGKQITGMRWELRLRPSTNMLLTRSKTHEMTCLRVINPLLCKWILSYLVKVDEQSIGDAVLEFLHSDSCRPRYKDMASKQLFIILKEIMKTREITTSGKPATFSRLIQELYDTQSVDIAAEILELMFDKTTDAYIAQQLARLYILCENWTKAMHFANEATAQQPNSSYLWDTHGQIFKYKLTKMFDTGISTNVEENRRLIQEAVECAYEGTAKFLKVQELSCSEPSSDRNTAGHFGEIDIYISLLEAFFRIPQFTEKSQMLRFINGNYPAPPELSLLTEKQIHWLKARQENVLTTLRKLEDEQYRYKPEEMSVRSNRSSRRFLKGHFDRLRKTLGCYFGDDDIPNIDGAEALTPETRRRQICRLGVNSLQSILKLTKEDNLKAKITTIYRLAQLNVDNPQRLPDDCRIALGSALAMLQIVTSPTDLPNFEHLLQTSSVLYNMKHDVNYIDLEPFLYLLVLHWPTANRRQSRSLVSQDVLMDALAKWNNAYNQKFPKDKRSNFHARDRPFFFLTNKVGVESIVHIDQLKESRGNRNYQLGKILGTRVNRQLLERFEGILSGNGWEVSLRWETSKGNKLAPFRIPLHTREPRQSLVNKKIYFVLGFGWSGPRACDIQTETLKHDSVVQYETAKRPANPLLRIAPADLYQSITHEISMIEQSLRQINSLKRLPRNQLYPHELQLIQQENCLISRRLWLYQERQLRSLEFL